MRSSTTTTIFFLGVLGLVSVVDCWGPLSHYSMGCQALFGINDIMTCDLSNSVAIQGMAAPDSFFFTGDFTTGTDCPLSAAALHDGTFAGFMVQQAQSENPSQLNFSLGFGSHVMSDLAAFETGYLSSPLKVLWLKVWEQMLAQDSYISNEWQDTLSLQEVQTAVLNVTQPLAESQLEWLSNSTIAYNQENPSFPVFTASDLQPCSEDWATTLQSVSIEATEKEPSSFLQEMLFYDSGSSTESEAESRFNRFTSCGEKAIVHWQNLILSGKYSPSEAYKQTSTYVLRTCP